MNYNKIIKLVKETNKFIVRSEQLNLIKKKSEADFVTDVDIKISNFLKEKGKNCDFFPFFFSFFIKIEYSAKLPLNLNCLETMFQTHELSHRQCLRV